MESRLTFLHRFQLRWVTEKARSAAAVPFKAVGGSSWKIRRVIQNTETEYEGTSVLEVIDATLRKSPLSFRLELTVP